MSDLSPSEVLDNNKSVLPSFGIQTNDEEFDLPYVYMILNKHKYPLNTASLGVSSECLTKPYPFY